MKTNPKDAVVAIVTALSVAMAATIILFEYMGWTEAIISWFA